MRILSSPHLARALSVTLAGALTATVHASPRVGPPSGDVLGLWIKERLAEPVASDALVTDEAMTHDMVTAPDSIYAILRRAPYAFRGAAWLRTFSGLTDRATPMTRPQATEALAWDLGMTNGYPGVLDPDFPVPDLGAAWAGTQLAKAGVAEDIARKALALTGSASYAVAANYAVAAQLLADKLACFEESQWAVLGLRSDVFQRYMLAESASDLKDYDLVYLVRLLQAELSVPAVGETTQAGRRALPTAVRIARVAAAFRDMQGYDSDPCTPAGAALSGIAATIPTDRSKAMCLVAALDRAVLYWYYVMLDRQMDPSNTNFVVAPAQRMIGFLRPMRPLWVGIFGKDLQVFATHVEVAESLAADRSSDSDEAVAKAGRYAARRAAFLCSKEMGE